MFTRRELAPLFRLRDEMDRIFESFTREFNPIRSYSESFPAVNIWEDEEGETVHVEAELPGISAEQLNVSIVGSELTISGERRLGPSEPRDQEGNRVTWQRRERAQGRFSRTITLPWQVDADRVQAQLRDGVLTVTLPKSEAAKPRKVKLLTA